MEQALENIVWAPADAVRRSLSACAGPDRAPADHRPRAPGDGLRHPHRRHHLGSSFDLSPVAHGLGPDRARHAPPGRGHPLPRGPTRSSPQAGLLARDRGAPCDRLRVPRTRARHVRGGRRTADRACPVRAAGAWVGALGRGLCSPAEARPRGFRLGAPTAQLDYTGHLVGVATPGIGGRRPGFWWPSRSRPVLILSGATVPLLRWAEGFRSPGSGLAFRGLAQDPAAIQDARPRNPRAHLVRFRAIGSLQHLDSTFSCRRTTEREPPRGLSPPAGAWALREDFTSWGLAAIVIAMVGLAVWAAFDLRAASASATSGRRGFILTSSSRFSGRSAGAERHRPGRRTADRPQSPRASLPAAAPQAEDSGRSEILGTAT